MNAANHDQTLQQVGDIWKFLDAMSVANPNEYKKFVDNVLKEGAENNMGPPVPRLAIQTTKKPEVIPVRNYFINIAEWKQMPKPDSKCSDIPMNASDVRKEIIDKEWAYVVDVVLNPKAFKNSSSQIEDVGLIEAAMKYIETKEFLSFSRKYQRRTEKYIGNQDNLLNFLCPSAMKNSLKTATNSENNNSLFEQLKHVSNSSEHEDDISKVKAVNNNDNSIENKQNSSSAIASPLFDPIITARGEPTLKEKNTKTLKKVQAVTSKLKRPKVEMFVDKEKRIVELNVYLPEVESVNECDLNLTENAIILLVDKKYELSLNLPVTVNVDDSKAKFVKDEKMLVITASMMT